MSKPKRWLTFSGVARAFPDGQAAYPKDHIEEENKEKLEKNGSK